MVHFDLKFSYAVLKFLSFLLTKTVFLVLNVACLVKGDIRNNCLNWRYHKNPIFFQKLISRKSYNVEITLTRGLFGSKHGRPFWLKKRLK